MRYLLIFSLSIGCIAEGGSNIHGNDCFHEEQRDKECDAGAAWACPDRIVKSEPGQPCQAIDPHTFCCRP